LKNLMRTLAAFLLFGGILVIPQGDPQAAPAQCDRACLVQTTNIYLAGLVAHDPTIVNWASNAKFVENIINAFMANPWLNGLILGVLLIGIILSFLRVIRLFPEISWVNRFRRGDPVPSTRELTGFRCASTCASSVVSKWRDCSQ
jgi:hypothetical protein